MKHSAAVAILAMVISCPVVADERLAGTSPEPYAPSLAFVMELTQLSHFKLWLAGKVRNWALADYELGQMAANLQDARRLFPNTPKADTSAMAQPEEDIRNAIKAKDGARFDRAFAKFTSACNGCHQAVGLGFIDMREPMRSPIMTSPFSNQSFEPK